LQLDRIESLVQLEPALVILGLTLCAWFVYKLLLGAVSNERHRNLKRLFRNLLFHLAIGATLYLTFTGLHRAGDSMEIPALDRINSYIGLLALFSGATCFVKVWRILVFEYLFLGSMREGVPLLIVNLVSLVLSLGIGSWMATEILGLKLGPLLATSAIASLVLGLALQETLGNLFSGVAMQLDKPYEIGDWIEIQTGTQKWTGQVFEISWRSTVLVGLGDETITVPNRVIAQAQIANFATKNRPIIRSHVFRLPLEAKPADVKRVLLEATKGHPAIRRYPEPLVLFMETTESWAVFKLLYFIDDYGAQFGIGDQVLTAALAALEAAGLNLASTRLMVLKPV
jgi:small-conductance mechanosensitive channel